MAGPVTRFLGGSPGAVLLRLVVLSLIVGFIMHWFGLYPADILRWFVDMANYIYRKGFAFFGEIVGYILLGAVIVVPIFLISRLMKTGSRR